MISNKFIWYRQMSLLSACAYLGCGQTCIDGMFGYKQCACYKDFRLNPDNRTCSHIGKSFTCNRGHSVLFKMFNINQQSKKIAVERSVIKIFIHWRKQTLWIKHRSAVALDMISMTECLLITDRNRIIVTMQPTDSYLQSISGSGNDVLFTESQIESVRQDVRIIIDKMRKTSNLNIRIWWVNQCFH